MIRNVSCVFGLWRMILINYMFLVLYWWIVLLGNVVVDWCVVCILDFLCLFYIVFL